MKELYKSRNFHGGFKKGLWGGLLHGRLITVTNGREPWTLVHKARDSEKTKPKDLFKPIEYPRKDGKLTFDLLTNLARSGTNHDHDQPSHLRVNFVIFIWVSRLSLEWSQCQWNSRTRCTEALSRGSALPRSTST